MYVSMCVCIVLFHQWDKMETPLRFLHIELDLLQILI